MRLVVSNNLFDSLFLPILLIFGSKVWGAYDNDDFFTWEKDEIEKTQIYFCKQTLGVNKQCPNVATRTELGRLPQKFTIDSSIIKFLIHLQSLRENDIAIQCLEFSTELAKRNIPRFMLTVNSLKMKK